MKRRLKKIAFLTRKPGLSKPEFASHWREIHGPTVANSPGYGAWRLSYAQSHVVGAGPIGEVFSFDGMAEFELPGDIHNEDEFAATAIYRDRIRVDELNFIDMDRTVSMAAVEEIAAPGKGAVKLVILSKRARDARAEESLEARERSVAAARESPEFGGRLRGWRIARVVEGSHRLPGGRATSDAALTRIESLWFDSPADMAAAFEWAQFGQGATEMERRLFADGVASFLAEEIVFFDESPTPAAAGRSAALRR